ncbi:MAG TPA: prepilin peptidase [Thermoanaerobaculia bacterium]
MVPFWLILVYVGLFGLIVGSYLNVLIHRLPLGMSTVTPRSRCPACAAPIRALDNLPVLSFLLLRGRCRSCGARISWRYPLLEAATALLFMGCAVAYGLTLPALMAAVFCCLMIVLAMIDVDHMILPDRITWPGIALGFLFHGAIVLALGLSWRHMLGPLFGALLGGGLPLAIYGVWWLIRREEGLGLGDAKMMALIGTFLEWKALLVAFFFAVLAGSIVGLALMGRSGEGLRTRLPFGAFLALGGLIALFAGPAIIGFYMRFL